MGRPVLVVGRGMVGSCFADNPNFEIMSYEQWPAFRDRAIHDTARNWGGFICAAGIAGNQACDQQSMSDILAANVDLPVEMLMLARQWKIPFVAISSSSVYRSAARPQKETDDVHPHGRYSASKIAMEHMLASLCDTAPIRYESLYILRLPFLVILDGAYNFGMRCSSWTQCEAVITSVVYPAALLGAVQCALLNRPPGGIYNIASGSVLLPNMIRDWFGWEGEVVPAGKLNVNPTHILDTAKAEAAGLIT